MELRALRYFVTVAEERNFRRAAARLHMTQPPLSRAIRQLETDLGAVLLRRSTTGVTLTDAGTALYGEARTLLAQAEQIRARITTAAGATALTVGALVDTAGTRLVAAFRERHPGVQVRIREADLTDPTTGLRAGLVDVALTRAPFDETGISTQVLRTDPIGVVLRTDDPLAGREILSMRELADRRWFRLPEDTDPVWREYWSGNTPGGDDPHTPVVRTVQECMQAVLWNGSVGMSPKPGAHPMTEGLAWVPLSGMPPSHLVVAWNTDDPNPLIPSFTQIAAATLRAG